jgi:hypothetical protein
MIAHTVAGAVAVVTIAACGGTTASDGPGGALSGCGTPKAGWIWCDDFETDRLASYFEVSTDGGSVARIAGAGRNGSSGMRTRFAPGQVSAGSLKLAFGRTPGTYFRPVDAGTKDYREIYWRFYVRNAPGWTGGGGDKLTRLTIFAASDWSQAMIAHVWSGGAIANRDYLVLDPASGTDVNGTLKTSGYNDFPNLRWLGAVRANTPIFDAAHVGQLEATSASLNWIGSYAAYGLNAILLESYWNAGSPVQQERFLDDFVVSELPIGCNGDGA